MKQTKHPTTERLEAFVEGTLGRADLGAVESHVSGCARCRAEVEEWRSLFTALAGLPQFDPSPGFAARVMAGVRVGRQAGWQTAWQSAWRQQAARATALIAQAAPKSTFGWGLLAAMLALPVVVGGGLIAWLLSRSYVTPQALWGWTTETVASGLQAFGATVIATIMQTDVAAWLVQRGADFLATAGMTGVGALFAAAGAATMLSIWVLYRNLIRTPTRESHYATYSF
jgi:hypothetical protein